MPERRPLGINVREAAETRIARLFDTYDTPVVSVSGGKDSAVLLELARREAARRRRLPVHAVFVDLEFVPTGVERAIQRLEDDPDVALTWVCPSVLYPRPLLGRWIAYRTWDPRRLWASGGFPKRPLPASAVTDPSLHAGDSSPMDDIIASLRARNHWPGSPVVLLGMRASESILRLLTSAKAAGRSRTSRSPRLRERRVTASPLYDWLDSDTARAMAEMNLEAPEHYAGIQVTGGFLRVGGEPHGLFSAAVRTMDPQLAQRFAAAYPDVEIEWRYGATWPGAEPEPRHLATLAGASDYIQERFDAAFQPAMLRRLDQIRQVDTVRPRAYPPAYVARNAWHLTWHDLHPLHDTDPKTSVFWRQTDEARDQTGKGFTPALPARRPAR